MAQPTVLISGASGLVGKALVPVLQADNWRVVRLIRSRQTPEPNIPWDPSSAPPSGWIDRDRLARLSPDAVIHLAGETVFGFWSAAKKRRILDSRVIGTRILVEALSALPTRPRTLLSASAVGYYGDAGDRELDEASPPGAGFLADVCRAWEAPLAAPALADVRTAILRIGVVLSRDGGAIKTMLPAYRLGLGGPIAGGGAWLPWISLRDTVAAIRFLLTAETVRGPVNLVAPNPVRQSEFAQTLGRAVHRPAVVPAPRWLLSAAMGEMARETALKSVRALPRKLESAGFSFADPTLGPALADILR